MTRRQLWIVGRHRAGADHDRIAESAHAMEMEDVLLAGHVLRLAGMRRDEAVEALSEVPDRHRVGDRGAADRKVEIDHRAARIVWRQQQLEAGMRPPRDHRVGMPRVDTRKAAVGAQRQRRMLVMLGEGVGAAGGFEHDAPCFIDFAAGAGLLRQRLRS